MILQAGSRRPSDDTEAVQSENGGVTDRQQISGLCSQLAGGWWDGVTQEDETGTQGEACVPTFLYFLRWLLLLDELRGLLWMLRLLSVTSRLCNGPNAS